MPRDPNEIGALWIKDSPKGTYMTGTVNGQNIVCFQNKSDNPLAPQWRVLRARPKADAKPAAPVVDDKGIDF